jgi:hypothetical protein
MGNAHLGTIREVLGGTRGYWFLRIEVDGAQRAITVPISGIELLIQNLAGDGVLSDLEEFGSVASVLRGRSIYFGMLDTFTMAWFVPEEDADESIIEEYAGADDD